MTNLTGESGAARFERRVRMHSDGAAGVRGATEPELLARYHETQSTFT